MSRTTRIIIGGIAGIALVAAIVLIAIYVSGGSGEASQPISEATLAPAVDGITFSIVPAESQVRFELDEDLRGQRVTVVGVTDQVAGQIRVDRERPWNTEVGPIRVNMRTMQTDNEFRNRAIRGQILLSAQDEFEFAEFVPTALSGLPETVAVGEPFSFQMAGDLTLRGISQPVTFDVTVTPASETRLEGSAQTTVTRAQFGLNIPSVPGVANVEEDVLIAIDFVALAG